MWLALKMIRLELAQSTQVQQVAARLWLGALAALAGVTLAMTTMAGYALVSGTWDGTRLFVFELPLLIMSHRNLSQRMFVGSELQWLWDIIAMILIALAALLAYGKALARPRYIHLLEGGALLIPCVALLPYTFSAANNLVHFLPLSVLVMVMSLIALTLWRSPASRRLLLIALGVVALPILSIALHDAPGIVPQADIHLRKARELTAGCTDLFPPDARSIFLGPGNYPVLYLMRPNLRPATPFINDDLGVQSSCALGSRIATDLMRAPRPLVVVRDTKPWSAENITHETSCGRIEAVMAIMPATSLGTCQLANRVYQVMVVR